MVKAAILIKWRFGRKFPSYLWLSPSCPISMIIYINQDQRKVFIQWIVWNMRNSSRKTTSYISILCIAFYFHTCRDKGFVTVNDREYVFHFRPKPKPKPEKHLALGRIPKPKPKVQIYVKIGGILLKFNVSNDLSN